MHFMWIWQSEAWPNFAYDAQALQPALASARLAQGRTLGVASSLKRVDLAALQLDGWAEEAIATAQIKGEMLKVNSVRASAGWGLASWTLVLFWHIAILFTNREDSTCQREIAFMMRGEEWAS